MGKMIEKNTPQNVIPIAATRGLGYTEAEAMLGDLISKDRVSDTAIRVARDHMIQFARKLPNMLPSVDEPENAETCATPLGQSGMTCALQRSEEHTSELQSLMRISYSLCSLR